jgi:hypothetical protein
MSGPGAPARHLSHFFVKSDGSSYEISVQGGFIHISGRSFKNYEQEGAPKVERLKGTELTVTYKSVLDDEAQKRGEGRKMILQTADIEMDAVDDEGELQTWPFSIPATWPACMLPPDASERQQSHNQLPALQAFFQKNVDSGRLVETLGVRSRTTLAREQIHSYTYSVRTDMKQGMPQNPYVVTAAKESNRPQQLT